MKNIYTLPTDKPSRLVKNNLGIVINEGFTQSILDLICAKFVNIYIISNEEIKDKCYVLSSNSITPLFLDGVINTASMLAENQWRKVILTDNKDLIADGVQAIDDEFLEWFVKNPSCNMVEISLEETQYSSGIYEYVIYKREIPKEEPKKIFDLPIATNLGNALTETMKSVSQHEGGIKQGETNLPNFKEEVIKTEEDAKIFVETMENIPEPNDKLKKAFRDFNKLKTLEEAAYKFSEQFLNNGDNSEFEAQAALLGVQFGAKWQQEQDKKLYSEEDLEKAYKDGGRNEYDFINKYHCKARISFDKWFEQFKKK